MRKFRKIVYEKISERWNCLNNGLPELFSHGAVYESIFQCSAPGPDFPQGAPCK